MAELLNMRRCCVNALVTMGQHFEFAINVYDRLIADHLMEVVLGEDRKGVVNSE